MIEDKFLREVLLESLGMTPVRDDEFTQLLKGRNLDCCWDCHLRCFSNLDAFEQCILDC